jgi:hypothetical protein
MVGGSGMMAAAVYSHDASGDGPWTSPGPSHRVLDFAAAQLERKCGGGPTDAQVPAMAWLPNGEVVYLGDMPGESGPARERFDRTPIAALGDADTEFELLCWNQAAALLDLEVRGAAFSIWTTPGPIDPIRAQLEEIEAALTAGFERDGQYAIEPDDWPAASPRVSRWARVEADAYVVTATHARVNRALFIVSSPHAEVPGHTRTEHPTGQRGVRSFQKHPAEPATR